MAWTATSKCSVEYSGNLLVLHCLLASIICTFFFFAQIHEKIFANDMYGNIEPSSIRYIDFVTDQVINQCVRVLTNTMVDSWRLRTTLPTGTWYGYAAIDSLRLNCL
jgi:hypothetical protein